MTNVKVGYCYIHTCKLHICVMSVLEIVYLCVGKHVPVRGPAMVNALVCSALRRVKDLLWEGCSCG